MAYVTTPNRAPLSAAAEVSAASGEVLLSAPDGMVCSMTPAAAMETAQRMLVAARDALDQTPDSDPVA
jgi:hypothetical protein